ncbi:MAG: DUF2244 domain-containing protein [Steroidobacteraceae bacterium]
MTAPVQSLTLTPNCSLTPRTAWTFFGSLCLVTSVVAALATAQGFWPVLPFAGLELGLLGWAMHRSLQRRHHRQTITITDESVEIEEVDVERRERVVFQRYWARVKMRAADSPLHPSQLLIESHGRRCEIGRFLNEQERRSVAQRLQRLLGGPPLAVVAAAPDAR